jgi:transposase
MDTRRTTAGKRRSRSKLERRRIVEETFEPGASVARVAQAHGVRSTQVYYWRRLYRAGKLDVEGAHLLPVKITDVPGGRGVDRSRVAAAAVGTIDIDLGHARVRIDGVADPECVRAALEGLIR